MSEIYPSGDHQITPNLGLALWGTDEVTSDNFILIDTAFGSGVGTVTTFSAGNLSPLFTTSVATATTTPALSFSLSTAAQNTVFAGPATGGAGAPTYRALVAADIPAGTVLWSALGNATANLTLANAAFTTTFNQTSAVAWLWANTTAAVSGTAQSSPLLELSGSSYSGSAAVTDTWTIQNVNANSTTVAGSSYLTHVHTGTTGPSGVAVPLMTTAAGSVGPLVTGGIAFSGTLVTAATSLASFGATAANSFAFFPSSSTSVNQTLELDFYTNAGTTNNQLSWSLRCLANNGGNAALSISAQQNVIGQSMVLACAMGTSTVAPGITLGGNGGNNSKDFSATSGTTQIGVCVGGSAATSRILFNPASGASAFVGLQVSPTINQTGSASGSYTGLLVNVVETALLGTSNKLLDLQAGTTGGTSQFAVSNQGHISCLADLAGQVTITAAATSQAVTFTANYVGTGQPIVVVTPTSDPLASGVPVGYWITYQGSAGAWTGFTVNIQAALLSNVTFNYVVFQNR